MNPELLHDRRPAIGVGLDLPRKVRRRVAGNIHRHIGETSEHFPGLQRRPHGAAQRLDGCGRRPRRDKHAEPFGELEPRKTGLGHGRHIGQQRAALGAGEGQRAQGACLDVRDEGADRRDGGRDLAAEQSLHGRRCALIGHVEILEVRGPPQHDAEEMQRRARARRSVARLPGIAFAPGDEIGQRLHAVGDHRADRQQHGGGVEGAHRREILQRVAERLVDVRVKRHRHGRRHDHDRAVGCAVLQHVHRDAAARTGAVLDDGRGRIALDVLGEEPRGDVARAARGKADQDARRRVQRL